MKKSLLFSVFIFSSVFGFGQNRIDTAGIENAPKEQNVVVGQNANKDTSVFTYAEVMPTFPGPGGLTAFLGANIKYPYDERQRGIQGTVYVSFVIEKDGSVTNIRIVKEVQGAPGFSKETIRVMSMCPKWKPGLMNGKPIRIEMTQPIRFTIPDPVPSSVPAPK